MRLALELPDPPALEPLLRVLSSQYQEVVDQLLQLQRQAQSQEAYRPILQALAQQQDTLVSAFERMVGQMQQGRQQEHQAMRKMVQEEVQPQQQASDALLTAIRGMRRSMTQLPTQFSQAVGQKMKQSPPQVIVKRTGGDSRQVVAKLDDLQRTVMEAGKRSRSRTFGSNY